MNTLRLPLGFWTVDEVVYDSDNHIKGSWKYVKRVIKWAKQVRVDLACSVDTADLQGGNSIRSR